MKKRRTKEEAVKAFEEVKKLVAQGMTRTAACEQVGFNVSRYNYRLSLAQKAKPAKRRAPSVAPSLTHFELPTGKLVALIGSPSMVLDAVRALQ